MKKLFGMIVLGLIVSSGLYAQEKGPDIKIINDKVTMQADAVPLGRLLRLLGQATGMESKVPPELANRNISARFSNLSFEDAVQKIFEGQPLDYFMVEGKSITVTGMAQANSGAPRTAGAPIPQPQQENVFVDDNPPFNPPQPMNNPQPAMIQTPFGAIPNPNANPNARQQPQQGIQQPNQPMVMPGQINQNPFGTGLPGLNTAPNGNQYPGGIQQNNPFGSPTNIGPGMSPNVPNGFPVSPIQGNNPFPTNPRPPNP